MFRNILNALIFLMAVINCSVAQISVNPNPASFETLDADLSNISLEFVNHSNSINDTGETIMYNWTREIVSAPEEWEFPVCDDNTCYFSGVSASPNIVTIESGESTVLDVHMKPNSVAGCGHVKLHITLEGNPDEIIYTSEYFFKVNIEGDCFASTINKEAISNLRVYPNPTAQYFSIVGLTEVSEITELDLYNIIGSKVASFDVNIDKAQFDISHLPSGMYMLTFVAEDDGIVKTIRINKSNIRP